MSAPSPLPARLRDLALTLNATLVGPDAEISRLASLRDAAPGDLTFYADARYARYLGGCRASGVLVSEPRPELACAQLIVTDAAEAFYQLAEALADRAPRPAGVHTTAWVDPEARVADSAHVGPMSVVMAGADVGEGAVLHAQVYVGEEAQIGDGVVLHPGVKVLGGCVIGAGTVIHAGTVIGADGFGYRWDGARHQKEPQLGIVVIEEDVEIGAGCAIDRAALGETRIAHGARIDNLVQVGHGAQVGSHAILCGQVGLGGSSRVGAGAILGGQAGVADHADVGGGAQLAAQSGVAKAVPANEIYAGTPAIPLKTWRRSVALFARLPALMRRLRRG